MRKYQTAYDIPTEVSEEKANKKEENFPFKSNFIIAEAKS